MAAFGFFQEFGKIAARLLRAPVILCQNCRVGFPGEDIIGANFVDEAISIVPGTGGNFAQVGDAPQNADFAIQRFTAAIVGQSPPFQPAHFVLQGKFPMHRRGDIGKDLRGCATPEIVREGMVGVIGIPWKLIRISIGAGTNPGVVVIAC